MLKKLGITAEKIGVEVAVGSKSFTVAAVR